MESAYETVNNFFMNCLLVPLKGLNLYYVECRIQYLPFTHFTVQRLLV